jgi:putative colanic acid biosynthesis UDP-glucose lipid carrier transferase
MSTYSDRGPFPGRQNLGLARSLGKLPAPLSGVDLQLRLQGVMRLVDWLSITVIGLAFDHLLGSPDRSPLAEALGIVLVATITVNCLAVARAYGSRSMSCLAAQLGKVTMAWTSAFACVAGIAYLTDGSARLLGNATGLWFGASGILLLTSRLVASVLLARWQREGRLVRNIAVLGTGPAALALAEKLRAGKEEVNLVGVFADVGAANLPAGTDGNLDLLAARASSGLVDEIMLAMPWSSPVDLNRAITRLSNIQVEISIHPALNELEYPPQGFAITAGVARLTVQQRPLSGWDAPVKRAEDIVVATIALAIVAPLFVLIALAIKIDSRGPIIFRQERHGFNNNRILMFKFRSMLHELHPDPNIPQARRNDPRVTRVGAFLRRTSLDELPQLLNVLRGDMSMVGPRPHADAHNEKYARLIDGYLGRHRMKPGITGWAQVNGLRGETETTEQMRRRLDHDLFYIANWSLLLDIKVILMTFPVVLRGTNAY